jgi:hypothetical protein
MMADRLRVVNVRSVRPMVKSATIDMNKPENMTPITTCAM